MVDILIPGQGQQPKPRSGISESEARRILAPGDDGFSAVVGDKDYHPSDIVGACTKCGLVGTLDFPKGYNFFKAADRVMDRKVIRAECPICRQETEFKPIPDKNLSGYPGLSFLNKAEKEILKKKGYILGQEE